jgi:hypothetical protein
MELESAARQDLAFVGVIGNDGAWGEMKAFHERAYGPEAMVAQDLSQDTRYEEVAEALGGYGERVERPRTSPALDRARESGVPAIVNVILDRDLPPREQRRLRRLTPHISWRRPGPFELAPTLSRNRWRSTRTRRWRTLATISSPSRTIDVELEPAAVVADQRRFGVDDVAGRRRQ